MLRFFLATMLLLGAASANATEAGWALLREGGHVVLLRHAAAGGGAEPANFNIEDCRTQRNLSERGKQQARKIGALFAARAAPLERVLSSRYCRCLDTASIAFGDQPEKAEFLDPLPKDEAERKAQLAAALAAIADFSGSDNLVMVTHQENIEALAGVAPREGEAVIVRPDGERLHVLARIIFN
jgi:phosphohistidine phosphatase SixA